MGPLVLNPNRGPVTKCFHLRFPTGVSLNPSSAPWAGASSWEGTGRGGLPCDFLFPFTWSSWGLPTCSRSFLVNIQYRRLYQSVQDQYLKLLTTQVSGGHQQPQGSLESTTLDTRS